MSFQRLLLLVYAGMALCSPHFEYRAIGLRNVNGTSVAPFTSTTSTGTSPITTGTNVFNISSFCEAQESSFSATYSSRLATTTRTFYSGVYGTGSLSSSIITQEYSTVTVTYDLPPNLAYASGGAKPPCCSDCILTANTIQFYWWPDLATPSQGATTSANGSNTPVTAVAPNGFTFTSPSVYMAFSSIFGQNYCSTVGEVWTSTTIGFLPEEISTIHTYNSYTYTSTIDGTITTGTTFDNTRAPPSPLTYADLAQNCSSIPGYVYFPDDPDNAGNGGNAIHDPCHPVLAFPPSLIGMQEAWKNENCHAFGGFGAYDPPQAVTQAKAEAKPTLSVPAQPGSTSTPTNAPATSTPVAQSDTKPTTSVGSSAVVQSPDTTRGDAPTSISTPQELPSPVRESPGSQLDEPSTMSSNVQQATTPNNDPQSQPTATQAGSPQPSPVQTTIILPGNSNNSPSNGNTAVDGDNGGSGVDGQQSSNAQASTLTIVQGTTDSNGQAGVATHTTVLQPQSQQTVNSAGNASPVGDDSAGSLTVLQDTTMANGQVSMVSSVMAVQSGSSAQDHDESEANATPAPALTFQGTTYTADASANFVVGSQTISAGGPTVTVDNTPIAVPPGAQSAVVDGSTIAVAIVTPAANAALSITLGGDVITESSAGAYVVAPGTTISVGGPSVTVDGTAYALETDADGQTMLIAGAAGTATGSANIVNYIMSAIGEPANSTTTRAGSDVSSQSGQHTSSSSDATSTTLPANAAAPNIRPGLLLLMCLMALLITALY